MVCLRGTATSGSFKPACQKSTLSRLQVAKWWGTAEAPDCSGFTIAQLQSLNFAQMDLTEFYASIVPNLPSAGAMQGGAVGRASNCYYGEGRCQ